MCLSVCEYVSMLVWNRLPNHAYYGDEAFAGDSVGLGLGQRLDFILKKGNFGAKSPLTSCMNTLQKATWIYNE